MNDPEIIAIIRNSSETRNIDFKRAMHWTESTKCARFEILRDVAALANAGGGFIVFGRNEPNFTTGTMSDAQVASFDPTKINNLVHQYLGPRIECQVETEIIEGDQIVVLRVPEFETSPLIFTSEGRCNQEGCRKSPLFNRADIFMRTKSQSSEKISDADDMRDLLKRGMLKAKDDLFATFQHFLSSPQSVEQPAPVSAYDLEIEEANTNFFVPSVGPWLQHIGHFDMTVHPAIYIENRIALGDVPSKIRDFRYIIGRNGIACSVPFQENIDVQNVSKGCQAFIHQGELRRYESVALNTSGLYRVVRTFMEDFKPNDERTRAELVETDRTLWIDTFVEQVTMFHLLARNIARYLLKDPNEEVQIDLRIDGLRGRTVTTNEFDHVWRLKLELNSSVGTENVFKFPLRTSLRELEQNVVKNAEAQCKNILWTFRVNSDTVSAIQRRLLGRLEPIAFPAQ